MSNVELDDVEPVQDLQNNSKTSAKTNKNVSFKFMAEGMEMGWVTLDDISSSLLQRNGWLCASMVDNYIAYVGSTTNPEIGVYPSANAKLLSKSLSALQKIGTGKFKHWIMPVCHQASWCLIQFNIAQRSCIIYHSSKSTIHDPLKFVAIMEETYIQPFVAWILDDNFNIWTSTFYATNDLPQQVKHDDSSGIFVISYAESLLKDILHPKFRPLDENIKERTSIAMRILSSNHIGRQILGTSELTYKSLQAKINMAIKVESPWLKSRRKVTRTLIQKHSNRPKRLSYRSRTRRVSALNPNNSINSNSNCLHDVTRVSSLNTDSGSMQQDVKETSPAKSDTKVQSDNASGNDKSGFSEDVSKFTFGNCYIKVGSRDIAMTLLNPQEWLSDDIVDNYIFHLRDSINPKVGVITSVDAAQLHRYQRPQTNPIFSAKHYLMGICTSGHWYLAHANAEKNVVIVYNSLLKAFTDDMAKKLTENYLTPLIHIIRPYNHGSFPHLKEHVQFYEDTDLPQQPNFHECGVFVVKYAESVLRSTLKNNHPVFPRSIDNEQVRLDMARHMLQSNEEGKRMLAFAGGNLSTLKGLILAGTKRISRSQPLVITKTSSAKPRLIDLTESPKVSPTQISPCKSSDKINGKDQLEGITSIGRTGATKPEEILTNLDPNAVVAHGDWQKICTEYLNNARKHWLQDKNHQFVSDVFTKKCFADLFKWLGECDFFPTKDNCIKICIHKLCGEFYCENNIVYNDIFRTCSHALTGSCKYDLLLRAASIYEYHQNMDAYNTWFGNKKYHVMRSLLYETGASSVLIDLISRAINRKVYILLSVLDDFRFSTSYNRQLDSRTRELFFLFKQKSFEILYVEDIKTVRREMFRESIKQLSLDEYRVVQATLKWHKFYTTENNISTPILQNLTNIINFEWRCEVCVWLHILCCVHENNDQILKSNIVTTCCSNPDYASFDDSYYCNMLHEDFSEDLANEFKQYKAVKVPGDGNCFWSALSIALIGDSVLGATLKRATYWSFVHNQNRDSFALRKYDLTDTQRRLVLDGEWANPPVFWLASRIINRRINIIERLNNANLDCFYLHYDAMQGLPPVNLLLKSNHFSVLVPRHKHIGNICLNYTIPELDINCYMPENNEAHISLQPTIESDSGSDVVSVGKSDTAAGNNSAPESPERQRRTANIPGASILTKQEQHETENSPLISDLRAVLDLNKPLARHVLEWCIAKLCAESEVSSVSVVSGCHFDTKSCQVDSENAVSHAVKSNDDVTELFIIPCFANEECIFISLESISRIVGVHIPDSRYKSKYEMHNWNQASLNSLNTLLITLNSADKLCDVCFYNYSRVIPGEMYNFPKPIENLVKRIELLLKQNIETQPDTKSCREKICNQILQTHLTMDPGKHLPYMYWNVLNSVISSGKGLESLKAAAISSQVVIPRRKYGNSSDAEAQLKNIISFAKAELLRDNTKSSIDGVINVFLFANASLGKSFIQRLFRKKVSSKHLEQSLFRVLRLQRSPAVRKEIEVMLRDCKCPVERVEHYHSKILERIVKTTEKRSRKPNVFIEQPQQDFQAASQIKNVIQLDTSPETVVQSNVRIEMASVQSSTNMPEIIADATIQPENEIASDQFTPDAAKMSSQENEHASDTNSAESSKDSNLTDLRDLYNISRSAVKPTKAQNFQTVIPRHDYDRLYDESKEKLLVRSYPYIISKAITLKLGCILLSKSSPTYFCSTTRRRNSTNITGWSKVLGYCHCGIQFRVDFPTKPVPGKDTVINVKVSGKQLAFFHGEYIGRPCNGMLRRDEMKRLRNTSAYRARVTDASREANKNPRSFLHGTSVPSYNTYKKIRHEAAMSLRKSKNPRCDLDKMKQKWKKTYNTTKPVTGYIQDCDSNNKLKVHLYSYQSVRLLQVQRAQQKSVTLHIDATGGIFKHKKGTKRALLYLVIAKREDGVTWPVAEMLNDQGNVTEISYFFSCIKDQLKGPCRVADIVCCDFSFAFIHATLKAFNTESIDDYIRRCYSLYTGNGLYPQSKLFVFICTAHLVNAFKRNLNRKVSNNQRQILDLAQFALARMQELDIIEQFDELTKIIVRTFGCRYLDDAELQRNIDVLKDTTGDLNGFEANEELLENPLPDDDIDADTIRERSKFFHRFRSTRLGTTIEDEPGLFNLPENRFFCPDVITTLETTYIPMFPFWNGSIIRHHHSLEFLRETSAVIESEFRTKKLNWRRGHYATYADYVRDSFHYHKGRIVLATRDLAKPTTKLRPYIRKKTVPKVSLPLHKKRTRKPSKRFTKKTDISHKQGSDTNPIRPESESATTQPNDINIFGEDMSTLADMDVDICYDDNDEDKNEQGSAKETWERRSQAEKTSFFTNPSSSRYLSSTLPSQLKHSDHTKTSQDFEYGNKSTDPLNLSDSSSEETITRGKHVISLDEVNHWMKLLPISTNQQNLTHILDANSVYFSGNQWMIDDKLIPDISLGVRFLIPVRMNGAWFLFLLWGERTKIYDFMEGYSSARFKIWESDIKQNLLKPLCEVLMKPANSFSNNITFGNVKSTCTKKSDSAVLAMCFAEHLVESTDEFEIENLVLSVSKERLRILRSIQNSELVSDDDEV